MKRLVQLLRFPEIKPILVMNYVFEEMSHAFEDYNCKILIVKDINELKNEGIIFMDNGALSKGDTLIIEKISKMCPDAFYITWYFQDQNYKPFKYMIRLGNYMLRIPNTPNLLNEYNVYAKLNDYCPFKFRANEDPKLVGTFIRKVERDFCFMGCNYKSNWVPTGFKGIYRTSDWSNYLNYEKRKEIYLSSTFALGFHADLAIDCGSISQRVFEGMAYGCVVLCDNPVVEKFTDGIVITVHSKSDLESKMKYYIDHPELIIEKQNQGYEWVKKYGTNRDTVKTILEKIKQVYQIEFDVE